MKIGDLVKIKYNKSQGKLGVVISGPREGVNIISTRSHTASKKVCEVLFSGSEQVATRACNDLEVIK